MMHEIIWDSVDSIEVIFSVRIGVVSIHHHYHLICRRPRGFRIHDIYSIQAMGYVFLQRLHMTVIRKYSEWFGCKLVGKFSASWPYSFKHSVHACWMYTMEVDRMKF